MRLLILGGTVFLGRAAASHALAAGHDVTCAARGVTGTAPMGASFIQIDRDVDLAALEDQTFDAVLDVSNNPGHVRAAVKALAGRVGHWTYVSSVSAYADHATPGQDAAAPLLAPGEEGFGERKVACEDAVRTVERSLICRPGLVVGPGDANARFSYWPVRLARGGEVLAPGAPERLVQYIDVDDLADWLVTAMERGLTGAYNGIGPALSFGAMLAAINPDAKLTWVSQEYLVEQDVAAWSGPRSLPLWLPEPEGAGFLSRDVSATLDAGLTVRSTAETARTLLDWWRGQSPEPKLGGGLTPEEESALLAAWHARVTAS